MGKKQNVHLNFCAQDKLFVSSSADFHYFSSIGLMGNFRKKELVILCELEVYTLVNIRAAPYFQNFVTLENERFKIF